MKVIGFSFVRNAIKYDYPIKEAITSILPICDEFIIAVGNSEDDTLSLIQSIDSNKIKIIETVWDDSLRKDGKVLAVETNKALKAIPKDTDWAFYIQGDEVIHEDYLPHIKAAMQQWKDDQKVEGLLFNYRHFYGSYDYIGDSRHWYRKEVRIIKNDPEIYSFRDAQGFQKKGRPLRVKQVDAFMHHYGWVRPPEYQQAKQENFRKYWHDDKFIKEKVAIASEFDYSQVDSLQKFEGTHPKVMKERISQKNWQFDHDISRKNFPTLKKRLYYFLDNKLGWRIGEYRNYKIV